MNAKCLFKLSSGLGTIIACIFYLAPGASAQQVVQGVQVFPANNIWNTRIDGLPVDKNSATYVKAIGASTNFHPDFGTNLTYGIPYNVVTGTPPTVPLVNFPTFQYSDESDPGPYPTVTTSLSIESNDWSSNNTGDRHVLMIDTTNSTLYELYSTTLSGVDVNAGSGAIFPLGSNMLRPNTWTSADAAGLPVFPGLVNFPEANAGPIMHAFRFTAQRSKGYIWPARHLAGTQTSGFPPFGQRFRLKQSFNISSYSPINQRILTALKQYGMFFADLGSAWYVNGVANASWDDNDLNSLKNLKGSDFEAVDESSLMISADSAAATAPKLPPVKPIIYPSRPPAQWTKPKK